jgi:hypothetical protein
LREQARLVMAYRRRSRAINARSGNAGRRVPACEAVGTDVFAKARIA